jgi:hemerythrin
MEQMTWLSEMTVGNAAIDAAHKALFDQMVLLLCGKDSALATGFLSLADKLERDFREEETLMEGIDFPGIRRHREEHAKVLSALHHLDPSDAAAAREVLTLMLQWFPAHVATMDAALVAALPRGAGAAPASIAGQSEGAAQAEVREPSAEELRLMADTMPGEGPGD